MLHGKTTFSQTTRSIISVLSSLAFPLGGPCSFIERHVFERKSFPSRMTTVIKQTIGGGVHRQVSTIFPLSSQFSTRFVAHGTLHIRLHIRFRLAFPPNIPPNDTSKVLDSPFFCDSACCETFSLLLLLLLLFPKIGIFSHAISIQLWIESLLLSFPQILRSPSHITTLFPLPRLNRRKSSVVWRGLLKQTNCFERNRRSRRSNVFNFSSFSSSSPFETLCNILQSI